MLTAEHLTITRGDTLAVDDVSLTAPAGCTIGIVGPNGSGKSTLLKALYRALIPDSGEVAVDGKNLSSMRRAQIAQHLSVVAQESDHTLPLPVYDYVQLGRLSHHKWLAPSADADASLVENALATVDATHLSGRLLNELSGGEQQRIHLARAIAQQADYLLLDEPTNHLDLHYQYQLLTLVESLPSTTIMVLHDLNLAAFSCDAILLMNQGTAVAFGSPDEVLQPSILEDVYRLSITTTHDHTGRLHLLFGPRS